MKFVCNQSHMSFGNFLNYRDKKYRIDGFYAQPCLLIDGILWKIMEVRRRSNGGYCLGIKFLNK